MVSTKNSKPKLKPLTVRVTIDELAILKEFCAKTARSQTDVVREFIRTLEDRS